MSHATFSRVLPAVCLWMLSITGKAQSGIPSLKSILDDCTALVNIIQKQPTEIPEKELSSIVTAYQQMETRFNSVYETGTLSDKKVLLYYLTTLQFNLGYKYSGIRQADTAYLYYQMASTSFKFMVQPGWFPLYYYAGSDEYVIQRSQLDRIIALYYTDMSAVCATLKKCDESNNYARLAIAADSTSKWNKFRASASLVKCKDIEGTADQEKLDVMLSFWKKYRALDSADRALVKLNENEILENAEKLATDLSFGGDGGLAHAMLGDTLFQMQNYVEAQGCFKLASAKIKKMYEPLRCGHEVMYDMMMSAYYAKDKEMLERAAKILSQSYFLMEDYMDNVIRAFEYLGMKDEANKVRKKQKQLHKH